MTTTRDVQRYQALGALYAKSAAKATSLNRTELMTAGMYERQQLRAAALRMVRRGEIEVIRREVWDERAQQWTMVVRRLKPAWKRKAWIVGGVVGVLLGLFATGWWVLATLAVVPVASFLGVVLIGFVVRMALTGKGQGSSGRVIEVITRVRIG